MTLRQLIATDAITVFCNTDDFAEPVVYYARAGGCPRPISAVVIREGVRFYDGQNVLDAYEVYVANDDTQGISSVEINKGGDAIAFPPRDDKQPKKHTVKDITSQDNGMLVLVCL